MAHFETKAMSSIEKFEAHMGRMRLFLKYIFTVQQIVPRIAIKVPKHRWKELSEEIREVIAFTRTIYGRPDLGTSPPDPLPVDPDCPEHLISDHLQERIGRNAPLFDLVNAPFTHPIGTELAMICVDNAWNCYDTLLKELIGEIKQKCPNHANVKQLKADEKASDKPTGTDIVLATLDIAPSWDRIGEYL